MFIFVVVCFLKTLSISKLVEAPLNSRFICLKILSVAIQDINHWNVFIFLTMFCTDKLFSSGWSLAYQLSFKYCVFLTVFQKCGMRLKIRTRIQNITPYKLTDLRKHSWAWNDMAFMTKNKDMSDITISRKTYAAVNGHSSELRINSE